MFELEINLLKFFKLIFVTLSNRIEWFSFVKFIANAYYYLLLGLFAKWPKNSSSSWPPDVVWAIGLSSSSSPSSSQF